MFRQPYLITMNDQELGVAVKCIKGAGQSDMAKTVLIVEDNELNMKLFNDLLEAKGHNIVQTSNGMEALDLAREHKTGSDSDGYPIAGSFWFGSNEMDQGR